MEQVKKNIAKGEKEYYRVALSYTTERDAKLFFWSPDAAILNDDDEQH
jgi:hypothetical protein